MPEIINDLYALSIAVDNKQSVYVPKSHAFLKPKPAAFIINLSGAILLRLFRTGMYVYEKQNKEA